MPGSSKRNGARKGEKNLEGKNTVTGNLKSAKTNSSSPRSKGKRKIDKISPRGRKSSQLCGYGPVGGKADDQRRRQEIEAKSDGEEKGENISLWGLISSLRKKNWSSCRDKRGNPPTRGGRVWRVWAIRFGEELVEGQKPYGG